MLVELRLANIAKKLDLSPPNKCGFSVGEQISISLIDRNALLPGLTCVINNGAISGCDF
jgi:hypothetical protein